MQQLLPDIKALYQRKYFKPSSQPPEGSFRDSREYLLHRAQRFQQTAQPASHLNNKPNCIKIIKEPLTQRVATRADTTSIISARNTHFPIKHQKSSHSSSTFHSHRLMQQLLQVSHQELTDLQSSLGGEKTLMSLLNVFFQKRHERHELSKAQRANSEFKPMQNLLVRRYQEEKGKQYRIKRDQPREDRKGRQKELAPWSVQDIEFP